MVIIEVACRYCSKTMPIRRHGIGKCGSPRYYCSACRRTFQLNYRYKAHEPGVHEQIVKMAKEGAGIRDTSRTLRVSPNTVIRHLRKNNAE